MPALSAQPSPPVLAPQHSKNSKSSNTAPGTGGSTMAVPWALRKYSYQSGYQADWGIQAQFFQYGEPIADNSHHRRFEFHDGSRVEIQAHIPAFSYSSDSKLFKSAVLLIGGLSATPFGPYWVLAELAALTATTSAWLPYDAAWQGYTLRYYARAQPSGAPEQPWGVQYMYGWKKSINPFTPIRVNGTTKPSKFPNFADEPIGTAWWTWKVIGALRRAPEKPAARHTRSTVDGAQHAAVQLVQALPQFGARASQPVLRELAVASPLQESPPIVATPLAATA